MFAGKCPGQDTRYWKAEDIHEEKCPYCGGEIEFWKTDVRVRCPQCERKVVNSRFNLGCAQWCAHAERCLGGLATGKEESYRGILEKEVDRLTAGMPMQGRAIKQKLALAEEKCRKEQADPLPVLAALVTSELHKLDRVKSGEVFLRQLAEEHHFPPEAVEKAALLLKCVLEEQEHGAAGPS